MNKDNNIKIFFLSSTLLMNIQNVLYFLAQNNFSKNLSKLIYFLCIPDATVNYSLH